MQEQTNQGRVIKITKIDSRENKYIHGDIKISNSNSMTSNKDILLHLCISTVLITVPTTVIYDMVEAVQLTHSGTPGFVFV